MLQYKLLLSIPSILKPLRKPILEYKGTPLVSISILKTSTDGKATQIRLRSVSEKDEPVSLTWHNRKPKHVQVSDGTGNPGKDQVGEVLVPAMGITILNVIW